MIVEGDTSKTYQEYEYSKPSPAYPSELTSHISAGSYQIPTENGIYEVTLTEDLRGLDDTYRDFIRFDSVSGTGYRENNVEMIQLTELNAEYYSTTNTTYILKCTEVITEQDATTFLCNRLKKDVIVSMIMDETVGFAYDPSANCFYIALSKDTLGITSDDTDDIMLSKAQTYVTNNPFYILCQSEKTRTALTFTKVVSSTLPVLPWTAYGENLVDIKRNWDDEPNWITDSMIVKETLYDANNDLVLPYGRAGYTYSGELKIYVKRNTNYYLKTSVVGGNIRLVIHIDGATNAELKDFYSQGNTSIVGTFNSEENDWIYIMPQTNGVYQDGTIGIRNLILSETDIPYEPFNSIPPESLIPSPDYPQQIYDLKDVTVTSRGRNLFDENILLNQGFIKQSDGSFYTGLATPVYGKIIWENTEGYTGQLKIMFSGKWNEGATGGGVYPSIYYTDGTTNKIPFGVYGQWVDKYIITTSGKTVSKIMWDYGTNTTQTWIKNFAVYKNEELGSDVFPPFDKYRCTSATISVVSSAFEISKTLYDTLPNGYGRYTEDGKYYVCDFVKMENGAVKYVSCIADDLVDGTLSFGTDGNNRFFRGGYPYTLAKDSVVYCTSTHLPGITHAEAYYNQKAGVSKMNGTISVTKQGIFADMTAADFNSWLVLQNSLGTPFTVRNIRQNPVVTNITDAWAQDLIDLKTAPYYTKLFADKETGGLSVTYKHF